MPVYDADGNELPGGLTPEEAKTLQEQAKKVEEYDKLKAEFDKLQSKNLNFERLRNKTEEEKKEIMEKMSNEQKMLYTELEDMRKERDEEKKAQMEEAKKNILRQLASGDADLERSLENQEKEFVGEAKTPQELQNRFINAFTLVKGKRPTINPLNSFVPAMDYTHPIDGTKKTFVQTDKGKELYKAMFGHYPGEHNKKS